MVLHVGVLPQGVVDSLLARLNAPEDQRGLRFLRLLHPRTGVPSLYLPYMPSQSGRSMIAEIQVIEPPNKRSWIMSEGTVIENGKLLVATPVDPAFLMIPILQASVPTDGSAGSFRPMDDVFEDAIGKLMRSPPTAPNPKDPSTQIASEDLTYFLNLDCARSAMKRVCEAKEITPEITVYRYSQERVIESLKDKVARLATPEIFESSRTLIRSLAKDGLMEDGKEDLLDVGRLRAACDLVSQYLPPNVYNALLASYDFAVLTAHLQVLADEAAQATAAKMNKAEAKESKSSMSSNTDNNEKKRKGAAKASHGVEQLKKANTRGMAKLSSFFQPKKAAT